MIVADTEQTQLKQVQSTLRENKEKGRNGLRVTVCTKASPVNSY